tara:strand:- start:3594 stop:4550 length:957 start_codon:yes stop_codon:yes gene_type:complete
MAEIQLRSAIIEFDCLNNQLRYLEDLYVSPNGERTIVPTFKIDEQLKDRFLENYLDSFWHSEKDQLEHIVFYSDGSAQCQKRKLRYDFNTESQYWESYAFTDMSAEQIQNLCMTFKNLLNTQTIVKEFNIENRIKKVDENLLFFDQTLGKRIGERDQLLSVTDWRVLPDIEDSYVGEKDEWIKYRVELRKLCKQGVDDYDTPLELFKSITEMKWPVDPKIYREKYPNGQDANGNAVEYLKADDDNQWVERETDSSTDIIHSKLLNIGELRQRYADTNKIVTQEVREMMQLLKYEDFVEGGIDYTRVYTQDEIDALNAE